MFRKILIANRGEIACRIIRTARNMGIRTVAVYSDADANALHVELADEAVHIGPPLVADSYLNDERIVAAAIDSRVEAVHPGYGFLAANADFVDQVTAAGLVFIGPSAAAIRAMSMKDTAKRLMERAGIPVVPGYHGEGQELVLLASKAREIGYPVMIKSRAGGGGKGMRKVDGADDLADALSVARKEAKAAFGDDRVLVEKYIERPRHIEVQVFGDNFGNIVHLYERDCSAQRRRQPVIEEAPAPGMTEEMRGLMTEAAIKAANTMGYSGAGTVEFIADTSNGLRPDRFWFVEMSPQLSVGHAVTEMVTGVDLVEWQLRIAAGEKLPRTQEQIPFEGHAVEARIQAEDPARDFFPVTGTLHHVKLPDAGPRLRIESGVRQGDEISHRFEPLIARLCAWGKDRFFAIQCLSTSLASTEIGGALTNAGFLMALVSDPDFASGDLDTGLVARKQETLVAAPAPRPEILSAALLAAAGLDVTPQDNDPWSSLSGYTHFHPMEYRTTISSGQTDISAGISIRPDGTRSIRVDGVQGSRIVKPDHLPSTARWPGHVAVFSEGVAYEYAVPDPFSKRLKDESAQNGTHSPLPGLIKAVRVSVGDAVKKGQPVLLLEAMQMEHVIVAPRDGVISEIVAEGIEIEQGFELVSLDEAAA